MNIRFIKIVLRNELEQVIYITLVPDICRNIVQCIC